MELVLAIEITAAVIAGGAVLAAGIVWCFVFPAVQNKIGIEAGPWKLTGLPTGALLLLAGIVLLGVLPGEGSDKPPKPEVSEVALATADGQPGVEAYVRCPFTVDLVGRIAVTGGEGEVAYRFVRQGYAGSEEPTEVKNIQVDEPGSYAARDSYTFNVPVGRLYSEEWLEVLRPEDVSSEPVKMRVHCDAGLPAGPPEPPPDVPGFPTP